MPKPEQCGHCDKPATIHLTQIINNKIHKVDLCEDCPHKQGVTDPEGFSLADFLLKPPAELAAMATDGALRCEVCGFTPADFKKSGRFGCPHCYESFKGMLKPMLTNMHRGTRHCGKAPERAIARQARHRELSDLRQALQEAVQDENYEEAARLRDVIRDLEAQPVAESTE